MNIDFAFLCHLEVFSCYRYHASLFLIIAPSSLMIMIILLANVYSMKNQLAFFLLSFCSQSSSSTGLLSICISLNMLFLCLTGHAIFKVTYLSNHDYKPLYFESDAATVNEIVLKVSSDWMSVLCAPCLFLYELSRVPLSQFLLQISSTGINLISFVYSFNAQHHCSALWCIKNPNVFSVEFAGVHKAERN